MSINNDVAGRRLLLQAGLGLVAAAAATRTAAADDKLAPELVQYQATPKAEAGKDAICVKCVNWVAPNACKIVSGPIAPNGWCVAFAPIG
jgi:hypothetical protein